MLNLVSVPWSFQVCFTGSTEVGRKIMQAAATSNLKQVSLELGGKSPLLIFDDADVDKAADLALLGILYNKANMFPLCAYFYISTQWWIQIKMQSTNLFAWRVIINFLAFIFPGRNLRREFPCFCSGRDLWWICKEVEGEGKRLGSWGSFWSKVSPRSTGREWSWIDAWVSFFWEYLKSSQVPTSQT